MAIKIQDKIQSFKHLDVISQSHDNRRGHNPSHNFYGPSPYHYKSDYDRIHRSFIPYVTKNDERNILFFLLKDKPVASIMSAPLIAIDKDLSVEKAAEIMIKNKVRHLGVRDGSSNHQIIGIISSIDLIGLLIHKLESIDNDIPSLLKDLYWQEEPMEEINF